MSSSTGRTTEDTVLGNPWLPRALLQFGRNRVAWLLAPAIVFTSIFFIVPIGTMVIRSLTDPSPINYVRFAESAAYPISLFTTIWMSAIVTAMCLALGYPYALAMYRARATMRLVLSVVLLLPFWSSLLVRTYAWTVLLRDTGLINWFLLQTSVVTQPLPLMGNKFAVIVGMTHVMLPYMALPIFSSMLKYDSDLSLAASGLGASRAIIFRRIFVPLTVPGVLAGSLLVFVLSVGFYITPAILGGRTPFFSLLIVTHVNRLLEFGYGSALGVILLAVVLGVVAAGARLVPLQELVGRGRR